MNVSSEAVKCRVWCGYRSSRGDRCTPPLRPIEASKALFATAAKRRYRPDIPWEASVFTCTRQPARLHRLDDPSGLHILFRREFVVKAISPASSHFGRAGLLGTSRRSTVSAPVGSPPARNSVAPGFPPFRNTIPAGARSAVV